MAAVFPIRTRTVPLNRDETIRVGGPVLAILWRDYLRSYVGDLRQLSKRGPTHFWELDQFARRIEWVADNHPGLTPGKKKWRIRRRSKPTSRKAREAGHPVLF